MLKNGMQFALILLFGVAAACGSAAAADPAYVTAVQAAVTEATGPCSRGIVVSGQISFDLSKMAEAGHTIVWSTDAGSFSDPGAWRTTWTAPAAAGTATLKVTVLQGDQTLYTHHWGVSVLATQADLDAYVASCKPPPTSLPPLTTVATTSNPATGLTVTLQASATHVAVGGWLTTSLTATNDGSSDVTVLDCYRDTYHVYLRQPDGTELGQANCDAPAVYCAGNTLTLHPGDSIEAQVPHELRFGASATGCGNVGPSMGLSVTADAGTYDLVAAVDLPPSGSGKDVEVKATLQVGP